MAGPRDTPTVTGPEHGDINVDDALDEAIRLLARTSLRAVLIMRDLCAQLGQADEGDIGD